MANKDKLIIGRVERIDFPLQGFQKVPAKIDTGADFSAIWASHLKEEKDGLHVVFFGKESNFYSGQVHVFKHSDYAFTRVSSSFGHHQIRYKVKIKVRIKGRLIITTFTLADRSQKLYPILLGRSLLRGKFLVDVTKGSPLHLKEKELKLEMAEELAILGKEVKG